MSHDRRAHGVVLTIEVRDDDASAADLVALADSLHEAAHDLAPTGTTKTSIGYLGPDPRHHHRRGA